MASSIVYSSKGFFWPFSRSQKSSIVFCFGVAVKAKNEILCLKPLRSISPSMILFRMSSGSAPFASSSSKASASSRERAFLIWRAASPDWELCASSMITAYLRSGKRWIVSDMTGNFCSVVTIIRLRSSIAFFRSWELHLLSIYLTSPSVIWN